eukprot:gnl/TRDRNA2_/TRDRNA2_128925_c0_seq1.p1 gnl/TRDRNA2_/TRDRNA2_128925_c0~~gnl/TRDRNA2_/TRDRNA2_128925_c0_seq1.p1  ORF type:complete len:606 (+),score=135.52 gnl/TRDRNA2_/TRDRNA2_128925_c0_seq1:170-1987(+)
MPDPTDLGLRPSLARYTFRPDKQEAELLSARQEAIDDDALLLATVERDAEVARVRLSAGQPKQAVEILLRTLESAEDHARKFDDMVPVSVRLARAAVRLQLCTVLSKVNWHIKALDMARCAMEEIDEGWRALSVASADLEEAITYGDLTRPAANFQKVLRQPPAWLARAVDIRIQARLCVALELEFQVKGSTAQEEKVDQDAICTEIGQLYSEGAHLARQLLPDDHPVRLQVERAEHRARRRWQGTTRSKGIAMILPSQALAAVSAAKIEDVLDATAEDRRKLEVDPKLCTEDYADEDSTECPEDTSHDDSSGSTDDIWTSLPLLSHLKTDQQPSAKRERPPAKATPADVVPKLPPVLTLGPQRRLPTTEAKALNSCSTPELTVPVKQQLPNGFSMDMYLSSSAGSRRNWRQAAASARHGADPFTEWRRSEMAQKNKSAKLQKIHCEHGMKDLKADIKLKNNVFKHSWLKDQHPDDLFAYRTFYSQTGKRILEKSEKRNSDWKDKAWSPSSKAIEQEKALQEMWQYYGLERSKSEPTLRDYKKLLHESLRHCSRIDSETRSAFRKLVAGKDATQSSGNICTSQPTRSLAATQRAVVHKRDLHSKR